MKLLANENIPLNTVRHLRTLGHDVLAITELAAGSTDLAVLNLAHEQQRILITFDRDYGELVYVKHLPCPACIIYLRFIPANAHEPAERISTLLEKSGELLHGGFIVLERDGYRRRPLPQPSIHSDRNNVA